jgi:signal transduction histidine kinase
MNTSQYIILLTPVLISNLMMGVSYAYSGKYQQNNIKSLFNLWSAFSIMTLLAFVVTFVDVRFYPLVLGTWIFPMKILKVKFERWEVLTLAAAFFASFVLFGLLYNPLVAAAPFVLALSGIGLRGLFPLQRISSYAVLGFFLSRLLFIPIQDVTILAFIDFASLSFLALTLIPDFFEGVMEEHKRELTKLVDQRNDKLIGQSKYAELGLMSAGIAHEINNPLAVIQAKTTQLLRLYRDPSKTKELAEGLEQILFTSERINRTIQGVREFVHQDENAQYSEFTLQDLIDSVLSFCGQRLKNHGVNLRFYGIENMMIRGNKIQLEQILLNLINNSFDAIEFLPEKWIELTAENKDEKVRLMFKDSGTGIPVELADKIMEPFFSTKDLSKGTGMGLSLARGIAEQHGGDLSYVRDSSHTTFLLELPLRSSDDWDRPAVH